MSNKTLVYVGTYTEKIRFGTGQILDGKGEGIYLLELDTQKGELALQKIFKNIINPSYLALDQKKSHLYVVNELKEYQGMPSGSVSSFKVSETTGDLSYINTQPTNGTDPCYVAINPDGTSLFVANFMSGSVSVFPLKADGSIGEMSQFIQHRGKSIDSARQTGPHAHSVVFSIDGRYVFVPDLGLDKLMIYQTGQDKQALTTGEVPYFQTVPGAGPRHCLFSADGAYCYLINELDCTIDVLSYNEVEGSFQALQRVSSLPEGEVFPGNSCADIQITPDGAYLYGSNRGHNSLIIYHVHPQSGMLTYVGCQSCAGEIPRSFAIEPMGKYLICSNQDSDNVVVFEIERDTGLLTEKSQIHIPTPVCVKPYQF